ncbi:hypothetical protein V5E97_24695 [Singulisphaera sp. Ch08]|uniref:Uncharacterized protein n=1 Tax=Singulisphaera sp. Ch08 TaxID=3120278 RepID=A0AAU7C8T0_9BACT
MEEWLGVIAQAPQLESVMPVFSRRLDPDQPTHRVDRPNPIGIHPLQSSRLAHQRPQQIALKGQQIHHDDDERQFCYQ